MTKIEFSFYEVAIRKIFPYTLAWGKFETAIAAVFGVWFGRMIAFSIQLADVC